MSTTEAKVKHPRSLYMLFFAEMWERFSFYGMRALLILYMTRQIMYGDDQAFGVYAAYGALVYATPFLGGLIADNILGYRKSVILGGVLMAIGHFLMAIEHDTFFYGALAFLIVGNGFFKPNISSMVGGLYKDDDPRRDGGFTIFYMGINLGALLAPLLCGIIGEGFGWHYGFGLAGIGMLLGLIVFWRGQHKLGDENGVPPSLENLKKKVLPGITKETFVYIASFIVIPLIGLLVFNYNLMDFILTPFAILVFIALIVLALKSEKIDRDRIFVILILIVFSTIFWAFFEQAGSSMTLFTARNVDRSIFGFIIPASVFQMVNPTFIVLLGPLFAAAWIKLRKVKKEPSTPLKFALGIIQLGLGFGALVIGASISGEDGMSGLIFLILGYLLHTTGELCLSPVGLSMVTKLSPKTIVAMVMGAWFLSSAMAHHFGGIIAGFTSTSQYMQSSLEYEAPLHKIGKSQVIVNVFDKKKDSLVSPDFKINIEIVEDIEKVNQETAQLGAFKQYASIKPGGTDTFKLRVANIDPNGDLFEIKIDEGQTNGVYKIDGDMLYYTAPTDYTGTEIIKYKMCNKEKSGECQEMEIITLVDTKDNHAPVLLNDEITVYIEKRGFFSKFLGKAELNVNVLDNMYDPDGDALQVNILQKPELGYAKGGKALNSFVTPAKTSLIYSKVFYYIMIFAVSAGAFLLILVPVLRKWMHGIH